MDSQVMTGPSLRRLSLKPNPPWIALNRLRYPTSSHLTMNTRISINSSANAVISLLTANSNFSMSCPSTHSYFMAHLVNKELVHLEVDPTEYPVPHSHLNRFKRYWIVWFPKVSSSLRDAPPGSREVLSFPRKMLRFVGYRIFVLSTKLFDVRFIPSRAYKIPCLVDLLMLS
jgi:hypothetical protein